MPNPIDLKSFVPPDSPILLRVAESVASDELKSEMIADYIKRMWRVATGEQGDASKPLLVGLAAPQVGISKRIILVDTMADGKGRVGSLRLYVNPEIVWASPEMSDWYEGCYSTSCVCGIVLRHDRIKIRAVGENGIVTEEEHSGYTARIFQHEIDHLDGRVFVTRVTDDSNLHWVEADQFPQYRNQQAWRNWPHKCTRVRWLQIKSGK